MYNHYLWSTTDWVPCCFIFVVMPKTNRSLGLFSSFHFKLFTKRVSKLSTIIKLRATIGLYELPDPLELLSHHPWTKERWKNHVKAAVMKYHESTLRQKSVSNSKLRFLNIQARGLCGKVHPVLMGDDFPWCWYSTASLKDACWGLCLLC